MRQMTFLLLLLIWQWPEAARAQFGMQMGGGMMAGAGMYGAGMACPGGMGWGGGAMGQYEDEEVADARAELTEAKRAVNELKGDIKYLERDVRASRADLEKSGLKSSTLDLIDYHIEKRPANCKNHYSSSSTGASTVRAATADGTEFSASVTDDELREFELYCQDDGKINIALCQRPIFFDNPLNANDSSRRRTCQNNLQEYVKLYKELEDMKNELGEAESRVSAAQGELRRAEREARRRARDGETEAGCVDCGAGGGGMAVRSPKWWETLLGVGLTGLGIYAGYDLGKRAIDKSAQLGFPPMYPYPVGGFGYPFALGGMYGGVGGMMGTGGFICMPGIAGGGFMSPMGMYGGGMGGGMFMPGMGPWGMAGPWMGGGMGGMMGMPMMGMPMMGMPMMGGAVGGVMGMPMMGMPMMGGAMGMPMMGGAMGMPMMGGAMGMPMMGGAMGMPMMGGAMGMPMMGGAMGMPMMGGAMGMPMMGGAMGGALGGWDYQQAMMQQQMLYYETMKRSYENNMEKTRLVNQLTMQLYQIQYQIQQVYMGGGSLGGTFGSTMYGSTIGSPTVPNYGGSGQGPFVVPRGQ